MIDLSCKYQDHSIILQGTVTEVYGHASRLGLIAVGERPSLGLARFRLRYSTGYGSVFSTWVVGGEADVKFHAQNLRVSFESPQLHTSGT